jgi:hypothetical protein
MDSFNPEWLVDIRRIFVIIPDDGEWRAGSKLASGLGFRAFVLHWEYPDELKDMADYLKEDRGGEIKEQLEEVLGLSESGQSLISLC